MIEKDCVVPFVVENLGVYGRLVYLDDSLSAIMNQAGSFNKTWAEILIFVSMLGSSLKSEGIWSCELLDKEGNITAVADYFIDLSSNQYIRGYNIKSDLTIYDKMLVTVDLFQKSRYQTILNLAEQDILKVMQECLENLSVLKIAVDEKDNIKRAVGIIIQKFPDGAEENWEQASLFVQSLKQEELLIHNVNEILYRLFHQDDVYIYEKHKIEYKCRCSKEKMERVFLSIPDNEKDSLKIDGLIAIKCEFCGKEEKFS